MKRILFLLLLIASVQVASAQAYTELPFTSADTLTNADTIVKNITLSSSASDGIILQPVITRLSGTAAGKIVLLQSVNGTDFIRTDSVTLSNLVTNTAFITKTSPLSLYYRIEFISSGTTALIPRLYYIQRKNK
jgi:hypothetical protein